MGPLVYYCRWRGAKLRLQGRNEQLVWGQLITSDDGIEVAESFRFDNRTWQLTLGEEGTQATIQLDELGVIILPDSPTPFTTNADAEP